MTISVCRSPEMLVELGWSTGGSRGHGNVFRSSLGVLQFGLDGSKLKGKMGTGLVRVKFLRVQAREGRLVMEIYGKLCPASLYHYTDNSVSYANRRWEDMKSTDYTDKPHFHH